MAEIQPKKIWDFLVEKIGNEYGAAGVMGNMEAESGLHSDIVQGDIPYSDYSINYTAQVDSGAISENDFVNNGPNGGGYGLVQWTFYTLKQKLYDMWKEGGYESIGSLDLHLDCLWWQLQNNFKGVLSVLQNATSVREASNKFLFDFENPADQGEATQNKRASMGEAWYAQYAGTSENAKIIQSAIEWAVSIANDDTQGYDQEGRWGPDWDCSSLLIQAYEQAGCPVKTNGAGYTGNMESVFVATGFQSIPYTDGMELIAGDVLLRTGHTAMYIGDGKCVAAHINEQGGTHGGVDGDQTGHEIDVYSFTDDTNWTTVLRLPSTGGGGGGSSTITPHPMKSVSKLLLFAIATDRF